MGDTICASCKRKSGSNASFTKFMCPNCGKVEIIRCSHCRTTAAKYTCIECGFTGPN